MDITTIQSVKKANSPTTGELACYITTLNDDKILFVPHAENNSDYQAIKEWEKIDGNAIEEAD